MHYSGPAELLYWKGKQIENMTREELIVALRHQSQRNRELESRPVDYKAMAQTTMYGTTDPVAIDKMKIEAFQKQYGKRPQSNFQKLLTWAYNKYCN